MGLNGRERRCIGRPTRLRLRRHPRWSRAGVVARGENRGKADRLKTFLLALSSQLRPGEASQLPESGIEDVEHEIGVGLSNRHRWGESNGAAMKTAFAQQDR